MASFTFLLPQLAIGGGTRVVAHYARELLALGHDVQVLARRIPAPHWRDVLRGRARFHLGGDGPKDFFADMPERLHMLPARGELRAEDVPQADFLVSTWWETVEWAMAMPPGKGRHVHLVQGYEAFPWLDFDRIDAVYRAPTCKIAVSGWIARMLAEKHDARVAAVVTNGVDTAHFSLAPERANPELTLGFVYSRMQIKNSAMVFQVRDLLRAEGVATRLVSFGVRKLPRALRRGSEIAFHYNPSQDRIARIYQSCDLWLFPSLEEGFGLPILEAMSCGTPVVSGRAGAAPDLVRSGFNGFIGASEPEAFAQAVGRYAALPAPAQAEMRQNARQTALANGWPQAARRFLDVLGV